MGIMNGKHLIASGPLIIDNGKLLLIKDNKDNFWKVPGGTVENENLEEACIREVKEEINGDIRIIRPLNPEVIWQNPTTKEKMTIVLIGYLAELLNKTEIKKSGEVKEIRWFDLNKVNEWKDETSLYVQFLIEKGDIK